MTSEETAYQFNLTVEDIQEIDTALRKRPWENAHPVIVKLQQQFQNQPQQQEGGGGNEE